MHAFFLFLERKKLEEQKKYVIWCCDLLFVDRFSPLITSFWLSLLQY